MEKDRKPDTARPDGETPARDEPMTERGLGGDQEEREQDRQNRAREHDIARRQMPVQR